MTTEQDFYAAPGDTSQGKVFTVTGQDWDSITQSIGESAEERVVEEVAALFDDPSAYAAMANAVNPYGDGHAAKRTVAAVAAMFDLGHRLEDFSPAPITA